MARSRWEEECDEVRFLKGLSSEQQAAPQPDLMDYFRLWLIRDSRYIRGRWIYHPDEEVKRQLEKEFCKYMLIYDLYMDDVMECLEDLYLRAIKREERGESRIPTIFEAEQQWRVFDEFSRYRRYVKRIVLPGFRFFR